jgi:hypothetical protein
MVFMFVASPENSALLSAAVGTVKVALCRKNRRCDDIAGTPFIRTHQT